MPRIQIRFIRLDPTHFVIQDRAEDARADLREHLHNRNFAGGAPILQEHLRGLQSGQSGSDDDNLACGLRLPTDHIFRCDHVRSVRTGHRRDDRLRSAGHNHAGRIQFFHLLNRCFFAQSPLDVQSIQLRDHRVHHVGDFIFERRLVSDVQRAAGLLVFIEQNRRVPAEREHSGRLHAGRTGADHSDFTSRAVLAILRKLDFPGSPRVDGAANRQVQTEDALPAIQASDALSDLFALSGLCFIHECGVGQLGSSHANEIADAFLEQLLRKLRILNGIGGDHRDVQCCLVGLCDMLLPSRLIGERLAVRVRVSGASHADVDGVDAQTLQILRDLDALLHVQETFDRRHLIAAHTYEKRVLGPEFFPDPRDDLRDKAAAVFHAPAVFIGPAVIVTAEEFRQQIPMCRVKLHAIITGLFAANGGVDELALHPFDILKSHLTGNGSSVRNRHCARRDVVASRIGRVGRRPGVVQLRDDAAVIHMHCIDQFFHRRHMILAGDPHVMGGRHAVDIVDPCVFIDDQADASLGPLRVVSDLTL